MLFGYSFSVLFIRIFKLFSMVLVNYLGDISGFICQNPDVTVTQCMNPMLCYFLLRHYLSLHKCRRFFYGTLYLAFQMWLPMYTNTSTLFSFPLLSISLTVHPISFYFVKRLLLPPLLLCASEKKTYLR